MCVIFLLNERDDKLSSNSISLSLSLFLVRSFSLISFLFLARDRKRGRAETIVACFAALILTLNTLRFIGVLSFSSLASYDHSEKMLMKLLVNVFERARSKLTVTRVNNHFSSGLTKTKQLLFFPFIHHH